MSLFVVALTCTSFALVACDQPITVHTATNPAASFDQYQTFSFGSSEAPPNGYNGFPRSTEVERRAEPVIAAALEKRGYVPAPASAGKGDLVILFGSGLRTVVDHEVSEVGQDWLPDDERGDFVEGSLVVDAFDGRKGLRVWHGASRAEINPAHIDDALLEKTVSDLLQTFPSGKAGAR
jgi:hypothetical protein